MRIAIHQPNFLPWLGYFYKIAKADIFVILDNVQYEKNGYTNRCQIKTPQGAYWLTIPVKRKFPQIISEVEMVNYSKESERCLKTIISNYKKTKYFDYLLPELETILKKDWQYLSKLNIELIRFLIKKMGLKTRVEIASDYSFSDTSTDLLINICKKFKADIYLSGKGGAKYQEEKKFEINKIKLEYIDFIHPVYVQSWKEFIKGLSIIDLLFNYGPSSLEVLLGNNQS